jgi:hypothetical protein
LYILRRSTSSSAFHDDPPFDRAPFPVLGRGIFTSALVDASTWASEFAGAGLVAERHLDDAGARDASGGRPPAGSHIGGVNVSEAEKSTISDKSRALNLA